ncbi:MAG: metallopeptidase family protein [Elusimicrobiota bacterium]
MKFQKFEKAVNRVVLKLPEKYRAILNKEKINILPREKVPRAVRERHPGKIVFGIFTGIARKDRKTFSVQTEPTRIEIYKESFEEVFGVELTEEMKKKIFHTVIHETAHYFGFDEDQLKKRGY